MEINGIIVNLSSSAHSNALVPCVKRPCDDAIHNDNIDTGFTTSSDDDYMCTCGDSDLLPYCKPGVDECALGRHDCPTNSTCTNTPKGFECIEPRSCSVDICFNGEIYQACELSPCQHGGFCIHMAGKEVCYCTDGFYGDRCEQEVDECLSRPCLNEAFCRDGMAHYTCVCPSGYTGRQCQTEIVCNTSTTCLNGGTCRDHLCLCTEGYTGNRCESQRDPCSDSPCQYGGTCAPDSSSYTCSCPVGAVGRNCEIFLYCTMTYHAISVPGGVIPLQDAKNSIRVSWHVDDQNGGKSADDNLAIHGYLLEYSSVDGLFVRNVTARATTKIIGNLNYFAFQFRVAAIGVLNDRIVCGNYSDKSQPAAGFPKISSK